MARRERLTEEYVAGLRPEAKPYTVTDEATRGLRVHVSIKGRRTYQVCRGGTTLVLGRHPALKLKTARELAGAPTTVVKQERQPVELRTVSALIDRYLATGGAHLKPSGRRGPGIRTFLGDHLLARPVSALTHEALFARQEALEEYFKGSTVRTYRKSTSIFCNWLREEAELIRKNPCKKLPTIPVDEAFTCLDEPDIFLLERACLRKGVAADTGCVVMMCLNLGLRRGEACALEWSDINWAKRSVHIRAATTKTRKPRDLTLPRKLVEYITARRDRLADKRPFRGGADWDRWNKLRKSAKLSTHVTLHGLRHTFASKLLRLGANLVQIRDAMGHSSLRETERNLHRLKADNAHVADLIDRGPVSPLSPMMKLPDD